MNTQIETILEQINGLFDAVAVIAETTDTKVQWDHLGTGFTFYPKRLSFEDAIAHIKRDRPMDAALRAQVVATLKRAQGQDEYDFDYGQEEDTFHGWLTSTDECANH